MGGKGKRETEAENGGIADEFASAGNVKGGLDAESERERSRKKMIPKLDGDRGQEFEEPRKEDQKRRLGDNDDVRKKKKKKKHGPDFGNGKWAVGEGQEIGVKGKKEKKKKKSRKDKPAKESARKVRFSDSIEISPSTDAPLEGNAKEKDRLVQGKRFSPEEDELIKKVVLGYIEDHGLGEDGLNMVLQCKKHADVRGCWKEIGAALPWRPYLSVYRRAHILFERSEARSFTEEERELIKKFGADRRSDWKNLADAMGKRRHHVRDFWRRIKLPNLQKGQWTQEEYQTMFDLVNKDLRMKPLEETLPYRTMLRDNICWDAISQKLSTRPDCNCCKKWYQQLSSPMVAEGIWADSDDYRLLNALVGLDACSMEEVDWDCLIKNRPGSVCRKRWSQMVWHIGEHGKKSFVEQVEILSEGYCPSLVEVREACDKKSLGA